MTPGPAPTARSGSSERHRAALLTRGLLNGPQVLRTLGACCVLTPQCRAGNVRTPSPGAIAPAWIPLRISSNPWSCSASTPCRRGVGRRRTSDNDHRFGGRDQRSRWIEGCSQAYSTAVRWDPEPTTDPGVQPQERAEHHTTPVEDEAGLPSILLRIRCPAATQKHRNP